MSMKNCPKCNTEKPIDEFYSYYSKVRKKERVGNYCKPCAKKLGNIRAKEYYKNNREKVLQYQKTERRDWNIQRAKEEREKLEDRYIICKLRQSMPDTTAQELRQFPILLEAKRTQILTSRIRRKLKENGKK